MNWTAIPNVILDNMHRMKGSTLQICLTVARLTLGYSDGQGGRREWDQISVAQFMENTGLSNRAVIDAIKLAIEDGWIERRENGKWYEYRLKPVKNVHGFDSEICEESSQVGNQTYEESSPISVKKVHRFDPKTCEESSPISVKKVHRFDPKTCEESSPTNIKKKKERETKSAPLSFGKPPIPDRREKQEIDELVLESQQLGIGVKQFTDLTNCVLEIAGLSKLVDAGDDYRLYDAKRTVLQLAQMGYATTSDIKDLYDMWRDKFKWRNDRPSLRNLAEFASRRFAEPEQATDGFVDDAWEVLYRNSQEG